MAKYYGAVGFKSTTETSPGIWEELIIEKKYYGDVTRNVLKNSGDNTVNGEINISNELSIVSDGYALENFYSMIYAEFMGAKWKIINIEVRYPRLILTIGGLYNGKQA